MSAECEPLSLELAKEQEEYRKISLNLLMAFLAIHAVSASNTLGALTLALLIFTISLHVATSTGFLQTSPSALSRFLNAIPLLGICAMATIELVLALRSPAIAAAVLLVCMLPPLIAGIQRARWYANEMSTQLPVRIPEVVLVPAASDVAAVITHN
ncbi:hypothetical protein HYDPIDRAFT_29948 [Hydnomerulius pinastri MD-312]|uniref:Unplaced genomic scaffold scaffold_19, whole genome shotgun sequence n=1 Tax=Hydnomerulius pinastri MD-312 TaxID=994086 RepID=A0A0C9VAW8_9AGAM|nr:hypothetical protein HYDPIDRAFT_29948 [Hydnomerulius pinastri MD-312]